MPVSDAADPPGGIAVPIAIPRRLARTRRRLDRAAIAGAQPHVTVLYPFLPASRLTPDVRADLVRIARTIEPFEVRFEHARRFDDGLVWLEPDPAEPFRALTAAVEARWPDHPAYGGVFDEVITHLTVAETDGPDTLAEAESAARAALPFNAQARRLEVWRQDAGGRWHPHWRIPLGSGVRR